MSSSFHAPSVVFLHVCGEEFLGTLWRTADAFQADDSLLEEEKGKDKDDDARHKSP